MAIGGRAPQQLLIEQRRPLHALEQALALFADAVAAIRTRRLPGPLVPDVLARVRALFARPDISLRDVAQFVESEQFLAAQLMALANSAYFRGGGERARSVLAAVTRIGLSTASSMLHALALRAYLVACPEPLASILAVELKRAFLVATVARMLAQDSKQDDEHAFSAGLFHNVGTTIFLYTLALNLPSLAIDAASVSTVCQREAATLNAIACETMLLPVVVKQIHDEAFAADPLVSLIHRAMWISEVMLNSGAPPEANDRQIRLYAVPPRAIKRITDQMPAILGLLSHYQQAEPSLG